MFKQFLLNTVSLVALNAALERATYKTTNGKHTENPYPCTISDW